MLPDGTSTLSQESLRVNQDKQRRNPTTNTTVLEAGRVPGSLPESIQPYVDAEAFAAVPEHGGSMQEALEQLKSNPNAPMPSCIRDLGFTSTSQLIERLEGRDDPTKRAPTISELREAKKNELKKQKSAVINEQKTTETPSKLILKNNIQLKETGLVPNEPQAKNKVAETIAVNAPEEKPLILSAEPEHTPTGTTKVKNVIDSRPETFHQIQALKDVLHGELPATELIPVVATKIVEERLPVIQANEEIKLILPSPVSGEPIIANTETPTFQYTPEDNLDAESVFLSGDTEHIETLTVEPTPEPVLTQTLDQLDELQLNVSDLTNSIINHELPEDSELEFVEISSEETNLDIGLDTDIYAITTPEAAIIEPPALEHEHMESPDQLQAYIASLEPGKAEAAEPVIYALAEALKQYEQTDKSDIKTVTAEIQEVEKLFVDLLEALGIQESDQSVQELLRTATPELFALNMPAHSDEISINLRNYLGTQEYKPATITSIIGRLVHAAKQKIQHRPHLGKYALAGTFA